MGIPDRYRDYILAYIDFDLFPSDTVISMVLSVLASVFTAGVWDFIIDLEQIKAFVPSKYIIL